MTNENLKNPSVPLVPDPQDLDLAIQNLQLLIGELPWMHKSFGRARMHPDTVNDDKARRVPKVYQGGGEYYPVVANDALNSYGFFRLLEGRTFDDYNSNAYQLYQSAKVDHITWVNLKQIDRNKDYIFTEELINEVVGKLNFSNDVVLKKVWDERPEDVFKGYTIEPNHRDLLMYPYAAFRIEFDLKYNVKCINS